MSGQDVSAGDPRKTALMLALAHGVLGLTEVMNVLEGADLSGGDYERLAPVAVAMKDAVGAFADEFAAVAPQRAALRRAFARVSGQDVSAGDPRKTALMLALAYGVRWLTEFMNVLEGADLSGGDYERLAPVAVAMKDAVGALADEFAAVAGTGE